MNKSKKYDITKNSKEFKLFSNIISFDLYKCSEYSEVENIRTREELEIKSEEEENNYLNSNILVDCINPNVVDKTRNITEIDGGIKVKTEYVINEQIGKFVERGN